VERRRALRHLSLGAAGACLARPLGVEARPAGVEPALRRSDVVFMYEADRPTYAAYGATVLAWGGTPRPASLEAARGVAFHGSVGMVTEFWPAWSTYQLRAAAALLADLRALAAREAGREVEVSANAGLLWPNHLADFRALDFFSAEIEHRAAGLRLSDRPLFAFRMADAMGRPLAATATGEDWAFVKERGCAGLVRGWIAAAYAAGHSLMAPHRQWCHTEEKGTHWYSGPNEAYAPLYRFVRESAALLDGYEAWAEVGLVMPHRSFVADRERWIGAGEGLSGAGVPYRLLIGGDDVVDRRLEPGDLAGLRALLDPAPEELAPADRAALEASPVRRVRTTADAIAASRSAVAVDGPLPLQVLPRVGPGGAVVHVLGRDYGPERDEVREVRDVTLRVDLEALGVGGCGRARVVAPGASPREVPVDGGRLRLGPVGLWTLVHLEGRRV
jgi:hypothetical protein